jgi:hypothetical protein
LTTKALGFLRAGERFAVKSRKKGNILKGFLLLFGYSREAIFLSGAYDPEYGLYIVDALVIPIAEDDDRKIFVHIAVEDSVVAMPPAIVKDRILAIG